jgi:hypothetical protein
MVFSGWDLSKNKKKEECGEENSYLLVVIPSSIGKYAEFSLL